MRNSLVFILILFSSSLLAGPEIQHWQTSRGVSVYFVETHQLPIVDIQLVFDAGSVRDPDDKKGLALITNNILSKGAGGKLADEISFEFERLGAIFSSSSAYDSASVSLRSLSDAKKLEQALANLKQVISLPDFPMTAFERQRNRLLVGLQRKKQSPGALARDAFYQAVYKDHPYAFPNEGNEETLQAIKREDMINFYARYYNTRNLTVAVVGDLNKKQVRKLVDKLTKSLKKGKKVTTVPEVKALASSEEIHIPHPSAQTHILVGQPGMKRGEPDYFPLYVGNHILGGGGMISRLFNEIREKRGLSYSAYSYFSPMKQSGPFIAGLQTKAEQANEALAVLRENLQIFVEQGPTEEELIASKKNITGGFPLRIDSNRDILAYIAVIGYYNLPLSYLDEFNNKIEAVTVEQIKDAFRRRIDTDKLITVMAGPVTVE